MPKPLNTVLANIAQGTAPRVILVGGTSEFLSQKAFHDIRDAVIAGSEGIAVEAYEAGSDLGAVLDSYRTLSLFSPARLLIIPEVNAFVSAKELASLYDKATADWRSSKTDRKRASSAAKLLHVLGLCGADLDMPDRAIAAAAGVPLDQTLADMLAFCRATGKKAGRGEGDAELLTEAIARGGASGTILLMRTPGEIPTSSSTVELIDRAGAVVVCDLTREDFAAALDHALTELATEANVKFEPRAVNALRQKLGIERTLADKFSREIPDIRVAISEGERLVTLAGEGGRVTAEMVQREVTAVEGGARYELGSLYSEGKIMEAIAKLRDLVSQARRDDARMPIEMQYGRFLFPLADELRQMIGIRSFARVHNLDLRQSMTYNRFKDTLAERLGDYLKSSGIVRQRPHPFPLHKKWEAARSQPEEQLWRSPALLADLDVKRKSGGVAADVGMELFLLRQLSR